MADSAFPDDLKAAQTRLHQATAEHAALMRMLSWSVEPHDGWTGTEHPHTGLISDGREPSPGWSDEQKAVVVQLRQECLALSVMVTTHPYWQTLAGEDLHTARMRSQALMRPDAFPAVYVVTAA
ncbi:hypothetical protein [Streptomyces zhihengii]|uniref:hypothetical protein n=1 Tax=Streptomyces zhihengii TaxID=1818004 RepID=UPI0033B5887D